MTESLLHLLHLTDPALPVGGFSHSAGMETAVQSGLVSDAASARIFVRHQLEWNIAYTDASLLSLSHRFPDRALEWDGLANAVKMPREMREASAKMGTRLAKLFSDVSLTPCTHYPVVMGLLGHALTVDLESLLNGFFYNQLVSMVTNAVKLVPLSQYKGQDIIKELKLIIPELAKASVEADESMVGLCCPEFDLFCMEHEILYSRLYMS